MANDKEVEIIETHEVIPSDDEELIESKETETPSESSTEKEPDEELSDETKDNSIHQPKPVVGETPKETALRKEVERLRSRVRDQRKEELFPADVKQPEVKDKEFSSTLLEKYDKDELNNFKTLIKELAPELGFVKKDELDKTAYQQAAETILDEFLQDHTELLPENDPDDLHWKQFQEEVKLYSRPQNPKDYKKILSRAFASAFGITTTNDDKAKIDAQQQKLGVASKSGGSATKTVDKNVSTKKIDSSLSAHLKGFSDDELKELGLK